MFDVTNTSSVYLEINWSLWMDERFPRRINSPVVIESRPADERSESDSRKIKKLNILRGEHELMPSGTLYLLL